MPEELVYGEMVAPHRVRLRGIPERWKEVSYDALLLVDFKPQKVREILYFPMLKHLEATEWETTELVVENAIEDVVTALQESDSLREKATFAATVLVATPASQSEVLESWIKTTTFPVERL